MTPGAASHGPPPSLAGTPPGAGSGRGLARTGAEFSAYSCNAGPLAGSERREALLGTCAAEEIKPGSRLELQIAPGPGKQGGG